MIITIALKKKKYKILTFDWFITNIIKIVTGSKYYHSEIIIGDKWISSGSPLGIGINVHNLRPLNNNWDYYDINVDVKYNDEVMTFLNSKVGTHYDWIGACVGGGLHINLGQEDKWYCSEIVMEVLLRYKYTKDKTPSIYSPGDIHSFLTN